MVPVGACGRRLGLGQKPSLGTALLLIRFFSTKNIHLFIIGKLQYIMVGVVFFEVVLRKEDMEVVRWFRLIVHQFRLILVIDNHLYFDTA